MIPYIQNSAPSKILGTSAGILDFFEKMPGLSMQMNLTETPKKLNYASINID